MITNVTEYLKRSAVAYPDKIAFKYEQQNLTFSELERQSRALACEIAIATGGRTRQPIGVYLPKCAACIVAFVAAAYSGNFYTPLDTAMPKLRMSKIADI
ncbi:MAG: AMP-binding protein, partial [Bacillota bacterium]